MRKRSKIGRRYGWRPDLPDQRDMLFSADPGILKALPTKVDLRPGMSSPYDQLDLGACTANAIGAAHEFDQQKQGELVFMPARLFIYYNERAVEGTVDEDSGAQIRDGIKSVASQGVCSEADWPYDVSRFTERPPLSCYEKARDHQALSYRRVPRTETQMKACLAAGFPFVYGFSVYESFESVEVAKTGVVPMPGIDEQFLGGHAVLASGYDDEKRAFIVRNSWGTGWGDGGYFYMPYAYLLDRGLASDFWTIRRVE